jgi:hypothetical protein
VIGALGISGAGYAADLPLTIAFVILAAFTYSSGLRAPASIAIVKDILIYLTALTAVVVIPVELGGFGKIFAAVPAQKLLLATPGPNTTGAYSAHATLALGSALALFLYPHSMTGILSASSDRAVRRGLRERRATANRSSRRQRSALRQPCEAGFTSHSPSANQMRTAAKQSSGTASLLTRRWREMDSNFQFLVARGCVPFGDGSLPTGLPKATEKGPKPLKP